MGQAVDSAEGRIPLVVLSEVNQGVKATRYAVMRLEDFVDRFEECLRDKPEE